MPYFPNQIHFILVRPSLPGNIGSAARALKVMGFNNLRIVAPKIENCLDHPDAIAMASGATDVLANAKIFPTFIAATGDCHDTIALSARPRNLDFQEVGIDSLLSIDPHGWQTRVLGLIFGNERTGLNNEELQFCRYLCQINSNSDYSSLNLAQAVQIVAYEVRRQLQTTSKSVTQSGRLQSPPANIQQIQGLTEHWLNMLKVIDFFDPSNARHLPQRLTRLVLRSQLETTEVNILRGIAKTVIQRIKKK